MNRTVELSFRGIPLRYTNPNYATTNDYVGRANVETLLDLVGHHNILHYEELSDFDSYGRDSFEELAEFMLERKCFPLILKRTYKNTVIELYLLEEGSYNELSKIDSGVIPEYMKHDFFYLLNVPDCPIIEQYAYDYIIEDERYCYIEDILYDDLVSLIEDDNIRDWAYDNKDTVVEILSELCSYSGEYPEEEPSGNRMYFNPSKEYAKMAIKEITDAYLEDTETSS